MKTKLKPKSEMTCFEKYAELKEKMKQLEDVIKNVSNECKNELATKGLNAESNEYGSFTIANRISYTFTPQTDSKIEEIKKSIKELENAEIQSGTALQTITEYLLFKPKK